MHTLKLQKEQQPQVLPCAAHKESRNKGISVHVLTYEQADEAVKHNIQRMVIDTEVMSGDEISRCVELCRKIMLSHISGCQELTEVHITSRAILTAT